MVAVLVCLLGGCASAGVTPPAAAGPPPGSLDQLPACHPPARQEPAPVIDGLALPDGAYLTAVEHHGPLTEANGWVSLSPVDVRAFYDDPPDGWETITIEDEMVEAEALLRSQTHRFLVTAVAACPTGSTLYLRIIADDLSSPP